MIVCPEKYRNFQQNNADYGFHILEKFFVYAILKSFETEIQIQLATDSFVRWKILICLFVTGNDVKEYDYSIISKHWAEKIFRFYNNSKRGSFTWKKVQNCKKEI